MPASLEKAAVPAVVVGADLNGLGVIRSLARAGVQVVALDNDLGKPGMRTRYGRKHQVNALRGNVLVQELLALAGSFTERAVLFLTQEASVRTVSKHRDKLEPYYRFTLPPAGLLNNLMHKESFRRLAEQHGFRVPRGVHLVDKDMLSAARSLNYPAILKFADKESDHGPSFSKAYRVADFEEASRLCRQIMPVLPNLILQEWVKGADADVYFCLQYIRADGRPAASFTGRKIRSWPPEVGGTASCIAAHEVARDLEAETTRFFNEVGFVGMGSMEYKRDPESGKFYLIEPTVGRTDYQEEVATVNGVNIPFAAYCAEAGLACPPFRKTSAPQVWRDSATDRWSAQLQHQVCGRGPLDSGPAVDGWWRWYDPLPGLALMKGRIVGLCRSRLGRQQVEMQEREKI